MKFAASGGRTGSNGAIVRDNYIHDNVGNGVWFDVDSGGDTILDNVISGNLRKGIFYEVSRGPVLIMNNRVNGNNTSGGRSSGAGIAVVSSKNVTIRDNEIDMNLNAAVGIWQDLSWLRDSGHRSDRTQCMGPP